MEVLRSVLHPSVGRATQLVGGDQRHKCAIGVEGVHGRNAGVVLGRNHVLKCVDLVAPALPRVSLPQHAGVGAGTAVAVHPYDRPLQTPSAP